jgi:hypothetical protein
MYIIRGHGRKPARNNRSHKGQCTAPRKYGARQQGGSHEAGELKNLVDEAGSSYHAREKGSDGCSRINGKRGRKRPFARLSPGLAGPCPRKRRSKARNGITPRSALPRYIEIFRHCWTKDGCNPSSCLAIPRATKLPAKLITITSSATLAASSTIWMDASLR